MDIKIRNRHTQFGRNFIFSVVQRPIPHEADNLITFSSAGFIDAHGHRRDSPVCSRAFCDADRRHHAGKILFRRGALRAGRAADARAGDAASDAQPDASAARQAAHRAFDPMVRRRAARLALSGRPVRIARHRRGISVRAGAVRGTGAGDRSEPARFFQPDAVRAIADRDAGYFCAHLQPVCHRRLHVWLSEAAAAFMVRAGRDRLRPVDRMQMERTVRARGLHRHRRGDPPDAKLAELNSPTPGPTTGTAPISGRVSRPGILRRASF